MRGEELPDAAMPPCLVEQDGENNDRTEDDHLRIAVETEEVHAVLDDGDDKGTDQRTKDATRTTG